VPKTIAHDRSKAVAVCGLRTAVVQIVANDPDHVLAGVLVAIRIIRDAAEHLTSAEIAFRPRESRYEVLWVEVVELILVVGERINEYVGKRSCRVTNIRHPRKRTDDLPNVLVDLRDVVLPARRIDRCLVTFVVDQEDSQSFEDGAWGLLDRVTKCLEPRRFLLHDRELCHSGPWHGEAPISGNGEITFVIDRGVQLPVMAMAFDDVSFDAGLRLRAKLISGAG